MQAIGCMWIAMGAAFANLVQNGNFAERSAYWEIEANPVFEMFPTAWRPTPNGIDTAFGFGGKMIPLGSVSQVLATQPGAVYTVEFYLENTGIVGDVPQTQFIAEFGERRFWRSKINPHLNGKNIHSKSAPRMQVLF